MANVNAVLDYVSKLCDASRAGPASDGQLLDQFVERRDEAAFATLVHRHGPLVWRGCRGLLFPTPPPRDGVYAGFLVFVFQAGRHLKPPSPAGWLLRLRLSG